MEIPIDTAAVERAVADAIVNSAIGAKIKVAVNEMLLKTWNSPLDKAIEQVVTDIALKMVKEEHNEQIRQAVRKKLEDETVDEFVSRFWDKLLDIKSR